MDTCEKSWEITNMQTIDEHHGKRFKNNRKKHGTIDENHRDLSMQFMEKNDEHPLKNQ